ncbi:hypothetical protein L2089_20815 [Paenibacillus hunanensis]|uniref:hypothetical protein n=1 Tax=Paenibacillus hunanensis TaxID=539262 RepID=UPI002025FB56|nr:hypothetical protein [Paenibacillus hunanensis]MCL9663130.1 hypothetical protein [Paenibacillus hunanensis]
MPKMLCTCGNVLNIQDIPCKVQYNFISDVDYDQYNGSIDSEQLYQDMRMFFKCDRCERLWVFWNGFDEEPYEYLRVPK